MIQLPSSRLAQPEGCWSRTRLGGYLMLWQEGVHYWKEASSVPAGVLAIESGVVVNGSDPGEPGLRIV